MSESIRNTYMSEDKDSICSIMRWRWLNTSGEKERERFSTSVWLVRLILTLASDFCVRKEKVRIQCSIIDIGWLPVTSLTGAAIRRQVLYGNKSRFHQLVVLLLHVCDHRFPHSHKQSREWSKVSVYNVA